MSERKNPKPTSEPGDPNPMEGGERRARSTWERPEEGGEVSAEGVARPRDKEAARGDVDVMPGFTGTGPSGSQSARSLYGVAPEEEPDADE
jgi:hypothetical protein